MMDPTDEEIDAEMQSAMADAERWRQIRPLLTVTVLDGVYWYVRMPGGFPLQPGPLPASIDEAMDRARQP